MSDLPVCNRIDAVTPDPFRCLKICNIISIIIGLTIIILGSVYFGLANTINPDLYNPTNDVKYYKTFDLNYQYNSVGLNGLRKYKKKAYMIIYLKKNKAKIIKKQPEYNKIYKANNKEKIRGYYQKYKDKKKAYAVANKEKIQKYMKEYNNVNKDKKSKYMKQYKKKDFKIFMI
jgi:hypothetical protein